MPSTVYIVKYMQVATISLGLWIETEVAHNQPTCREGPDTFAGVVVV